MFNSIEIGTWEGASAVWWLQNLLHMHPESRLVLIDPCPTIYQDLDVCAVLCFTEMRFQVLLFFVVA